MFPSLRTALLVAPIASFTLALSHHVAPTTAPHSADTYVWCESLTGPPLTRYVSRVFLAPAANTVDVPALFGEVIKQRHHPKPQELSCNKEFPTREAAEEARAKRVSGQGQVLKLPTVEVEWRYEAAPR